MPTGTGDLRCCMSCGAVYRAEFPHCVNDGAELVMMVKDPLVGTTVGPYIVDSLLGEGGMGRVYRVHHARLTQKRYALKVLLGDFAATPSMRTRFAKEAQSASRLSHPNVVAVCDFGMTDKGLAYLAMDLVEGTPLSHLIARGPISPDRMINIARQLCMGLQHAHDLGLIHRDLKPDNIIVLDGPGGEVPRIADFGLAISNDDNDPRLTTGGIVLGTPAYVAPEQCTDTGVDHRADLYALGVTMFEGLAGGTLPFDGDPAVVVGLKVTSSAPRFKDRVPHISVPPALAAIVDRLVARRSRDRYADARAVAEALELAIKTPDDASIAGELPAREVGKIPTPAMAFPAADPKALKLSTGFKTDRVRMPDSRRTSQALIAGAILLSGAIIAAVVWATRGPSPASAPQPAQAPPAPAPSVTPLPAPPPAPTATAAAPSPGADRGARAAKAPPPKRTGDAAAPAPRDLSPSPPAPRPAAPAPRPAAPAVRPAAPPAPAPAAAPPAQTALELQLAALEVSGGMQKASVSRGLDRVMGAARACRSDRPGTVEVRFTIGESKRATGVRASAHAAGTCLVSALSGIRTDAAPDTGDVSVTVRFSYVPRKAP